jgi:subtilisin family serine protease
MLATFERAGMIKRVVPLYRAPGAEQPPLGMRTALAILATAGAPSASTAPLEGLRLIEMQRDSDVPGLQIARANDPHVEAVSRVPVRYLLARRTPTRRRPPPATAGATPPAADTMWNLRKLQWRAARAKASFREATDIRVAVLDTGVDRSHPDLPGAEIQYTFTYPGLPVAASERDLIGHGTHVSGTIRALVDNGIGVNGICACKLNVWKIFTDEPVLIEEEGLYGYVVEPIMYRQALAQCLDQGIQVINLSIGGPAPPDFEEQRLFNALLAGGVLIVAAMGNARRQGSPVEYPGAIPGVIAIGATNLDDTYAEFSTAGNHISLCAPGVSIWSTLPTYRGQTGFRIGRGPGGQLVPGRPISRETGYDAWDGTSMATPHVTAAAALLLAKSGSLTPATTRDTTLVAAPGSRPGAAIWFAFCPWPPHGGQQPGSC